MYSVDKLLMLLDEMTRGTVMGIAPGDPLSKVLAELGPCDPGPRGLRVYGLLEVSADNGRVNMLYIEVPDDVELAAPDWIKRESCRLCDADVLETYVGRAHITLCESTMNVMSFATW